MTFKYEYIYALRSFVFHSVVRSLSFVMERYAYFYLCRPYFVANILVLFMLLLLLHSSYLFTYLGAVRLVTAFHLCGVHTVHMSRVYCP